MTSSIPSGPAALLCHVDRDPDVTVRVPAGERGWLTSNDRGGWTKHHRTIRHWREQAGWAAVAARVRPIPGRVLVLGEVRLAGPARRRDAGNWYPSAKAALDGLVDVGVLPDDRAEIVVGPDMRFGPRVGLGYGALHLHLWRIGDG